MMFSQNNEQTIIGDYFDGFVGTFLDCGANDGITFSNTRELAMLGWAGLLVEPSPVAFRKIYDLYLTRDDIFCLKVAVSDKNGVFHFYESGTHLKKGDHGLLSTLNEKDKYRWIGTGNKFETIKTDVVDFKSMLKISPYQHFDFVSLDCEGEELKILPQMNLKELGVKMICVEWNSKDKEKFDEIITPFGLNIIHKNAENLLYAK